LYGVVPLIGKSGTVRIINKIKTGSSIHSNPEKAGSVPARVNGWTFCEGDTS